MRRRGRVASAPGLESSAARPPSGEGAAAGRRASASGLGQRPAPATSRRPAGPGRAPRTGAGIGAAEPGPRLGLGSRSSSAAISVGPDRQLALGLGRPDVRSRSTVVLDVGPLDRPPRCSDRLEVGDPVLGLPAGLPLAVQVRAAPGRPAARRPGAASSARRAGDAARPRSRRGLLRRRRPVGLGVGLRPGPRRAPPTRPPTRPGGAATASPARPTGPRRPPRRPGAEPVVLVDRTTGDVERRRAAAEAQDRPQDAAAPGAAARSLAPDGRRSTAASRAGRSSLVARRGSEPSVLDRRLASSTSTAPPGRTSGSVTASTALVEHLLVLDRQLAADRVVVERAGAPGRGDVEAGEVAARGAAVAGGRRSAVTPDRTAGHVARPARTTLYVEHVFAYGRAPWRRRASARFDDLGHAAAEVTFCVLDLETTGGRRGRRAASPRSAR